MSDTKIKVVCLGDSITWGFPFGPEYSWVQMLNDTNNGKFINEGINGDTTSDMINRFEGSVIKYNPTHVIIMGGINDVIARESYDRITWNLRSMAERAQENGIKVIFGIPTAIDDREYEVLVGRIRVWMKDYVVRNNLNIIDFAKAFFDNNGAIRLDLMLADGGHPNAKGYKSMFKQIDLNIFR